MFAVIREQLAVVRVLLEAVADRTLRSPEGRGLLELAAQKSGDITELLSR